MRTDLRQWIRDVERCGQLQVVRGADWNKEIGTIVELNAKARGPALLFDEIKDYPPGFRVLTSSMSNAPRLAATIQVPTGLEGLKLVGFMKDRMHEWDDHLEDYPPLLVEQGVVWENVDVDNDVNILKFPAPLWHGEDGGRYIGTGSVAIMRDPDTGWVNLGTYRVMVHDERSAGIFIAPGHHGQFIMEKYWSRGKPCPIAISAGHHPIFLFAGSAAVGLGTSEYNYIGSILKERVPVVNGRFTDLPVPAFSEVVLEGHLHPNEMASEGMFGEWPGYYVSEATPKPVIRVKAMYYRNDPILLGAWPGRPPHDSTYRHSIIKAANLWELLERARISGVTGVYRPEAGAGNLLTVLAIKQMYDGHARQAATVASQLLIPSNVTRYVIAVDDDIDITNLEEVMWAVCTRTDPQRSITIVDGTHANVLEPMVRSRFDERSGHTGSCAIIDACRPFRLKERFPRVTESSEDFKEKVKSKWSAILRL